MIIKIEHYTKILKKNMVLNDISLELSGGNIYGLKGVNGSGKTMLMRAICGLIFPTSGCIKIDEKVLGKDISFPESVGVLIENPSFISNYTGKGNLKLLASIKQKIADSAVDEALINVGLQPEDKRIFRKYSLGMKQKLGIAAAIMESPDLLILDEPLNALDSAGAASVKEIIYKEKERGALIIISCHDTAELIEISDYIISLENGSVIGFEEINKGDE